MSARNGDKARFNKYRRRKLAKRQRVWSFFEAVHARPKPGLPAAPAAEVVAAAPPSRPPVPKTAGPAPTESRPPAAKRTAAAKPAGEKKPRAKSAAKQ